MCSFTQQGRQLPCRPLILPDYFFFAAAFFLVGFLGASFFPTGRATDRFVTIGMCILPFAAPRRTNPARKGESLAPDRHLTSLRDHPGRLSFLARSWFTTAGFALPPVFCITWPTNQPAILGLAATSATLSGLAAITASIAASIADVSVT